MRRLDRTGLRRRGSTLAEMVFTLALCVTVMGAATLLYGLATSQTLDSVALLETSDGSDRLAREIDFLIANAIDASVQTIAGRRVLKLTMPAERGERNANGLYDAYAPSYLHPRIADAFLPGERVWIFCGTSSGAISSPGDVPLLARRLDDATPGTTDVDWQWTYRDGDAKLQRRSAAPTSLNFALAGSLVTWTIGQRASSGTSEAAIDANKESTFRDLQVEGSTLLRLAGPQ